MDKFKVVELCLENKKICFSVESSTGTMLDKQHVKDVVEEAIIDAKESSEDIYDVGDQVAFALGEAGYIVRDIPNKYEKLEFDIEKYKVEDLVY